ncbi:MAG: hypothetical protein AB1814_17295 [Thermodesulfobacteriota bacterium]
MLALLLAVSLLLAVYGKLRREPEPVLLFLDRAERIEAALERFAADHHGAFPPDAFSVKRPYGLEDRYIKWRESWLIDYEVHPNGRGGEYVCLEFVGPRGKREYLGLCDNPEIRRRYGRGQAIPRCDNRIWVIREQARIMPLPPRPGR